MHQTFLVINALFEGDHGLCSVNSFNIIKSEDDLLGMVSISGPYLTEHIKFPGGYVSHGDKGNLIYSFQYKFRLRGILKKDPNVRDECIA